MTMTAEVKALLDSIEDFTEVYRMGHVPEGASLPYVTILDPIADDAALRGDARTLGRRRLTQVDIWAGADDPHEAMTEAAVAALDGTKTSYGRIYVQSAALGPEEEDGVVHVVLTLSAARA